VVDYGGPVPAQKSAGSACVPDQPWGRPMEFYLSFQELLSKFPNTIILVFVPIFIFTILVEALVIQARHGSYSWKNTGVSTLIAIGHPVTQAAVHGVIFGVIAAAVYQVRLTTISVSFQHWPSLIALFVLTDLAFYVEHRCSHRIRLMWASHSVHHSTERMVASAAFRLSWTPLLSGVFLFYLPIVWIGYDPVWVFGTASAGLTYSSSSIPSWCRGSVGWNGSSTRRPPTASIMRAIPNTSTRTSAAFC
jgi:sterol desaturase/sphingolipid hydroxylase (fatty acid hydroxylase superfamily)